MNTLFILRVLVVALCSLSLLAPALAKPAAQVRFETSYYLLSQAKSHLDAFIRNKDQKALKALTSPWGLESESLVKKDLAALPATLKIEIKGNVMEIHDGATSLQFQVEDPLEGKFLVNGKAITIHPYHPYERVVQRIEALVTPATSANKRSSLWSRALLPEANALGPAVLAAARAIPVAAGYVVKHGKPVAVAIGKNLGPPAAWLGKKIAETVLIGSVGTTIGACLWLGKIAGTVTCFPPKVLCAVGHSESCVAKTSELAPEIQEAKQTGSETISLPKLINGDRCEKVESGFSKDISLLTMRVQDLQVGEKMPPPVSRSEMKIKYRSNAKDPKKLSLDTITEKIYGKNEKVVIGERVWKFSGEDFKVEITDLEDPTQKLLQKPATVLDCKKDANPKIPACADMVKKALLPFGDKLDCRVQNSEQVIEDLKTETPASHSNGALK